MTAEQDEVINASYNRILSFPALCRGKPNPLRFMLRLRLRAVANMDAAEEISTNLTAVTESARNLRAQFNSLNAA